MEQGTIIFLAILFLAIAIPILISSRKKKKNENILLNRMNEFAQKSNAKLSDYQRWKDLQIGIDQQKGKFFFIRNTQNHESTIEVDLSQVQTAKVVKAERMVNAGSEKFTAIDKIDVIFPLQASRSEAVLNFYNSSYDNPTVQGELQVAEKWKDIANSWISQNLPKM